MCEIPIPKQIFEILQEYYKYEQFINNKSNNSINFNGYLINKESIDKFKKIINYEELKNMLQHHLYGNFRTMRLRIGKLDICKIIENEQDLEVKKFRNSPFYIRDNYFMITQEKFENSEELIKALNDNKKFYIINNILWIKICKSEKYYEKGNISCILNEDEIILDFKNEQLKFKINNGLIENCNILEKKKINNCNDRNNIIGKGNELENTHKSSIEKEISINKKLLLEKELEKKDEYKIKFDTYLCINCKSEIELKSIKLNNNQEVLMIYNCQNNECGDITIPINEYFKKLKYNTYLSEICYLCGKLQIKEYFNNDKNIFIYCIDCNMIYCNKCMEKHKKEHNNYMKMNEKNSKCLIHQNNDFCCYCFDDKKNLCIECLKDNSHLEHFKLFFDEISPIKIGDKNEEIEIFDNILNYYKQKINDINEEKKRKINDLYNKKKMNYNQNMKK